jgi:hypothetical protein
MTEQQRASAELARRAKGNAGLARAMGYQLRLTVDNLPDAHVITPDGKRLSLSELPDYFTDAAASRELMVWLAKQDDDDIHSFICFALESVTGDCELGWEHLKSTGIKNKVIMTLLTAEPSVIARAACKALGIEVGE